MKHCLGLFVTLLLFMQQYTYAQQTFYEPVGDTLVRFFFDENYYLVDQNCEFKAIERVIGFNKDNNKFEGQFKDFHVATGHVILSGSYRNGIKTGDFKAYYPDGKLRWETTFHDNEPFGPWRYYYADGKPHLFITLTENSFTIDRMWDDKGEQVVTDGNGSYNLDSPVIGFTEHGYTYFNRSGKVQDGFPEGEWPITIFIPPGKIKAVIGKETFKERKLVHEISDAHFFRTYYGSLQSLIPFSILPSDYFARAEHLLTKACTFDEFSGFSHFIGTKFNRFLKRCVEDLDLETEISYRVRVSRKGIPNLRKFSSSQTLTKQQTALLRQMVSSITYYLPSYLDGKPIKDNLTVHFTLHWDENTKHIVNLKVEREKGQ